MGFNKDFKRTKQKIGGKVIMELEKAKKQLNDLYDIAEVVLPKYSTAYSTAKITYIISEEQRIALKTVLKALENSIDKEVLKQKRWECIKQAGSYDVDNATIEQHKLIGGFEVLNKLLEEK